MPHSGNEKSPNLKVSTQKLHLILMEGLLGTSLWWLRGPRLFQSRSLMSLETWASSPDTLKSNWPDHSTVWNGSVWRIINPKLNDTIFKCPTPCVLAFHWQIPIMWSNLNAIDARKQTPPLSPWGNNSTMCKGYIDVSGSHLYYCTWLQGRGRKYKCLRKRKGLLTNPEIWFIAATKCIPLWLDFRL